MGQGQDVRWARALPSAATMICMRINESAPAPSFHPKVAGVWLLRVTS